MQPDTNDRRIKLLDRRTNIGLPQSFNQGFCLTLTFSYSSQHKNTRLFNDPVGVEEQALQEWKEVRQEVISENIGHNV